MDDNDFVQTGRFYLIAIMYCDDEVVSGIEVITHFAQMRTHKHTQTFHQIDQTSKLHSLLKFPEVAYKYKIK